MLRMSIRGDRPDCKDQSIVNANFNKRFMSCVALFILSFQAESSAAESIRFERHAGEIFLSCEDVAKKLNLEFKVVTPNRLATFCETRDGGVCIPIRLADGNHRGVGEETMIDARVLTNALSIRVTDLGQQITIAQNDLRPKSRIPDVPAYNAEWGEGRGFGKGQTLPDIPLVDLTSNEVRFSQFLGKRYILYCWASW